MLCKSGKNNRYWGTMIVIGIVTLVFSIVSYGNFPEDAHNMYMLMGMFSGLGGTFTVVGIIKLIRYKKISVEKLKEEEIELKDERNIQVSMAAYSIANKVASFLFVIMAFLFVWLDYRTPAFISIGALYIQILAFFIARKYFNRKM
ncbi:hypothetical protein EDD65_11223 [Keratinibaculum paraultunense]|uniref:Uncharacterized protein n=1 Tax=Keratinibaculum paraultunense TaxID=1278232 RepID=A0A4R3KQE1_9FIRM|nr:hypothetical protein [Keratinibaculum paraultunense]QQY79642.1 hypothetical protein JL105_10740 [Keratinibaculum paraultunense]TCS87065.1 hypothetical protein EDD65_11223 [Keratinibaculum paraultunense]